MIVVFGAIMYFLMIRPQQKRMKEHQQMVDSLAPGSRVLLTSGVFATIVHAGERQFIVELAPGVEVTVLKGHVSRAVTADEEEFEFDDAPVVTDADADVQDAPVATDEELRAMFDEPARDDVVSDEPRTDGPVIDDPNRPDTDTDKR
ncbi:preprotein translocase subunit YajC [Tessaracoccus oleiagri]|uniref:Preprotein translocase subunit YajC n=2 Tax=Tessaracoccus oleiagri TaxID=686624 RepID=A0A1G9MA91_9ACTN|nr:preprotein translocase subunit YajC [Tessaracoccus oleiagri]